jgi:hypothetical protein
MTRDEILDDAIVRQPHPVYGKLTQGRWKLIQKFTKDLPHADPEPVNGIAWVLCTRSKDDAELVAAMNAEDPVAALVSIYEENMHVLEAKPFLSWFNAELGAGEAAATTAKEDTSPGKSGGGH